MIKSNNSLRFKNVFRSLKYRNYRLFFGGQGISLIGTWMQRIAMPWLVYRMTGSELLLGLVSFAGQLPTFLLSPVAGVLTDRWSRYRVMIVTQVVFMIQASVLALLSLTGSMHIWEIVVLSIVNGCLNAFDVPARQSFVINMVSNKEDLGNAIALNSMMFNGARIIGPSIAGILLATTSEGACFLSNAISYIFVIASLLAMRVEKTKSQPKQTKMFHELREGFRYTFGFAPIKHLLLLLSLINLTGMSYQVLMPVFAKSTLLGDSHTYGFLMGAAGVGALIGAIYLAARTTLMTLGRLVPSAALLFGAGLISLSLSRSFPASMFLIVFVGAGLMLQTASSNTILQTITEEDKRGRVMSFYTMAVMGTAPFGSFLAGTLAKLIGTPGTILFSGIVSVLAALAFFRKLPELRTQVKPVYVKLGVIPEVATGLQKASQQGAESGA